MTKNLVKFASFMKTQTVLSWFVLRLPADCWFVPVDGVHVHTLAWEMI